MLKEGVVGVEKDLKNVRNKIRFVLNLQGIWGPQIPVGLLLQRDTRQKCAAVVSEYKAGCKTFRLKFKSQRRKNILICRCLHGHNIN